MAEIRLEGISKRFAAAAAQPAVDRLSLCVHERELLVLLGPSGCGKTTLLRTIAGLEQPDSGRVLIDGSDVTDLPPRKRDLAMVFQSYAVFPHLTAFDNIAFGLRMRRRCPAAEVRQRVQQAAEMLQLEPYLGRYPAQLSGGQRQRVAVARAIVVQPAVLLVDEPLSNLDALLRLQFRAELKKLLADLATTTIYVTHDQTEALSLGSRIAVMRAGRLVQVGAPQEVYDRPETEFVGAFLGNPPMNFLRGVLARDNGAVGVRIGDQWLPAPAALADALTDQADADVLVGIRAENLRAIPGACAAPGVLHGETVVVEPLGSHLLVTASVAGQAVKFAARTDAPVAPGQAVALEPEPGKIRWLCGADGTALAV